MNLKTLFYVFIILNIMDVCTTVYAIQYLELSESNPIINVLMISIGIIPALVLIKTIGISFIWIEVSQISYKKINIISMIIICMFFINVIINNLTWIISK